MILYYIYYTIYDTILYTILLEYVTLHNYSWNSNYVTLSNSPLYTLYRLRVRHGERERERGREGVRYGILCVRHGILVSSQTMPHKDSSPTTQYSYRLCVKHAIIITSEYNNIIIDTIPYGTILTDSFIINYTQN